MARLEAIRNSPRPLAARPCRRSLPKLSTNPRSWKDRRAYWRKVGRLAARGTPGASVGAFSPSPSCITMSRGEEALGVFSLKQGARSSEAEWVGTAALTTRCLLKTRPIQVSSSSKAVASTAHFFL